MRQVYGDVFDYLWQRLAGRDTLALRQDMVRRRLARVRLAQKFQSYYLQSTVLTITGIIGERLVALTKPLTFPALVIDAHQISGVLNEIKIMRTNSSRVQISIEDTFGGHIASSRFIQARWLEPLTLMPNELLQALFTLRFTTPVGVNLGMVYRVIGLNRQPCPPEHWQEIEDYINREPEQYPIYLPCYTPTGRTITFPEAAAVAVPSQRSTIVTREIDTPMLITAVGYNAVGLSSATTSVRIKFTSSDGHSFTPDPIMFSNLFSGMTDYAEQGPGGSRFMYSELPMPHYLPKGGTISATINDASVTTNTQQQAELVFRGVTI